MSRQNASLHLVCVALTMSHLIIVTISVSSFSLPGCKGAACAADPHAGVFVVCCGILLCLAVSPERQNRIFCRLPWHPWRAGAGAAAWDAPILYSLNMYPGGRAYIEVLFPSERGFL